MTVRELLTAAGVDPEHLLDAPCEGHAEHGVMVTASKVALGLDGHDGHVIELTVMVAI